MPAGFGLGRGGQERGGELFVKAEQILHPLAVGLEGFGAVTFLHRAIQLGVSLDEFGRHGERVVKVGEGAGGGRDSALRCPRPGRGGSVGDERVARGFVPSPDAALGDGDGKNG